MSLSALAPPAASEDRAAYLDRLRSVCAVNCLQPRELLRTARKHGTGGQGDLAGILDITHVTEQDGKYLLHQQRPNLLDISEFGFELPQRDQSPIDNLNAITVELDRQTALDLLKAPVTNPVSGSGAAVGGDILVEGDRTRRSAKPSLAALNVLFRDRRIVVRGTPRLEVGFKGARRDHKNKRLTIELGRADDVVLLPRYDTKGEPILDGPLEGLGA